MFRKKTKKKRWGIWFFKRKQCVLLVQKWSYISARHYFACSFFVILYGFHMCIRFLLKCLVGLGMALLGGMGVFKYVFFYVDLLLQTQSYTPAKHYFQCSCNFLGGFLIGACFRLWAPAILQKKTNNQNPIGLLTWFEFCLVVPDVIVHPSQSLCSM